MIKVDWESGNVSPEANNACILICQFAKLLLESPHMTNETNPYRCRTRCTSSLGCSLAYNNTTFRFPPEAESVFVLLHCTRTFGNTN